MRSLYLQKDQLLSLELLRQIQGKIDPFSHLFKCSSKLQAQIAFEKQSKLFLENLTSCFPRVILLWLFCFWPFPHHIQARSNREARSEEKKKNELWNWFIIVPYISNIFAFPRCLVIREPVKPGYCVDNPQKGKVENFTFLSENSADDAATAVTEFYHRWKGQGGNEICNSSAWLQQLWKLAMCSVRRFYRSDHDIW